MGEEYEKLDSKIALVTGAFMRKGARAIVRPLNLRDRSNSERQYKHYGSPF